MRFESSYDTISADEMKRPYSVRGTQQTTRPTISPEYSPPPPAEMPSNELNNLWAESGRNDSPGLQINHELRTTVNLPEDLEVAENLEQQLSPIIAAATSIQEREREISNQPGACGNTHAAHQEDEEMLDAPTVATVEEVSPPQNGKAAAPAQNLDSPSQEPALVSSATNPGTDILFDVDMATEWLVTQVPQSLEAERQQKAATFDTSELDSFLMKQVEPESDFQPTPHELAETQIWGHINPNKVWPKETSEEWLAEKRQEIDARGGRKANYGKLLTAQVRKERMEKGWHIHQNSEAVPDEKIKETAKRMEELFGIKGIDELIPGVRNGRLVMMEKSAEENGRKKRKVKVYPVL